MDKDYSFNKLRKEVETQIDRAINQHFNQMVEQYPMEVRLDDSEKLAVARFAQGFGLRWIGPENLRESGDGTRTGV